ncbi:MAG: hypothetical protein L0287_38310 [Anaerolineae bacterium]|nr:hypothetical protein [Anaerolineae bacterium]
MKTLIVTALATGILSISLSLPGFLAPQSLSYQGEQIYLPNQRKQQPNREWQVATFRGLKIGKSTLDDTLRILGKPRWSGPEAERDNSDPDPPLYYSYEKGGEFPGELAVIIGEKSKKVLEIRNLPQNLSKVEAILHFGSDYVIARYEFCPDVDGTAIPIYPDPNGQILQIEYRGRGIVLALEDNGAISEISYVSGNEALPSKEDCKRWARKARQSGTKRKPL